MRYGPAEIARAKTMKVCGFAWRPRLGDWFVSHSGYCEIIRSHEQAQQVGKNGHVFLPDYQDCRAWLAARGWLDPEFRDAHDRVHMVITHQDGSFLRAKGVSDLDCLYQVILQILLR